MQFVYANPFSEKNPHFLSSFGYANRLSRKNAHFRAFRRSFYHPCSPLSTVLGQFFEKSSQWRTIFFQAAARTARRRLKSRFRSIEASRDLRRCRSCASRRRRRNRKSSPKRSYSPRDPDRRDTESPSLRFRSSAPGQASRR